MKNTFWVAILGAALLLSGCDKSQPEKSTPSSTTSSTTSSVVASTTTNSTSTLLSDDTGTHIAKTTATKTTVATIARPTSAITEFKPTTTTATARPVFTTQETTMSTTTTNSFVDIDAMYQADLIELNAAYDMYKQEIEMQYNEFLVGFNMERSRLEMEIARLQGAYLSESINYQKQITNLEKKRAEAAALGATNSYYQTLAKQYQDQINSLASQLRQIENNYGKQIQSIEKQIQELPTEEELLRAEQDEYANLDAWYNEQFNNLNAYYGK